VGIAYNIKKTNTVLRVSYARLIADEMAYHLTQGDTGQFAVDAIKKGDLKFFKEPVRLIFGKSLVESTITGDILEGVTPGTIPFRRIRGYQSPDETGLSIELAGPWLFYRDFAKAHDIDRISGLLKQPEVMLSPGEKLSLPITIHNPGPATEVTLRAVLPAGWKELRGRAIYPVEAHGAYTVQTTLQSPADAPKGWVNSDVVWNAEAGGKTIGTIHMRVLIGSGGLPQ